MAKGNPGSAAWSVGQPGPGTGSGGDSTLTVRNDILPVLGAADGGQTRRCPRAQQGVVCPSLGGTSLLRRSAHDRIRRFDPRMHHHAFVVSDQERNRHFIEDLIGLPLVATWCEHSRGL